MNTKSNLQDVAFLIPLRVDSIGRLENLLEVIKFINRFFDTNIHVLEATGYNNQLLSKLLPAYVTYTFIQDYDPVFYRTYYINQLLRSTNSTIVGVWDSDVLVAQHQIEEAVNLIRAKKADFVLPYKDKFLDTTVIIKELYLKTQSIKMLKENEMKMNELYGPDPVGGGFFAHRKTYLASGAENEFFYGWGREDGERVNRWNNLGYKLERVDGNMYHLTHKRGRNSRFHSWQEAAMKQEELTRLAMMSSDEIKREIRNWK